MKGSQLKPLDKKIIQPYGIESPALGLKWVNDAKKFFGHYPLGSQLSTTELVEQAEALLPHWTIDERQNPLNLTTSEIAHRLNLGGGNKSFGEPRLQVFYHQRSRSYLVIDAMELVDQINVAESMAKTGLHTQAKLEYALQIATSQMKLELSAEAQQTVLDDYANEVQGVQLAIQWADRRTRTLKEAVHTVLGNGNGEENGEPAKQLIPRNKK